MLWRHVTSLCVCENKYRPLLFNCSAWPHSGMEHQHMWVCAHTKWSQTGHRLSTVPGSSGGQWLLWQHNSVREQRWFYSVFKNPNNPTDRGTDVTSGLRSNRMWQVMGHWVRGMFASPGGSWGACALHPLWQQKDRQRCLWWVSHAHTLLCAPRHMVCWTSHGCLWFPSAVRLRSGIFRQHWTPEHLPAHYVCAL